MTLRLIAPRADHAEAWLRWRRDPESRRFIHLPQGALEDWAKRLADSASDLNDRSQDTYRWIAEESGVAIGTVTLAYADWTNLSAELGYVLAPQARGKGHALAMTRLALDLGFAAGLERIAAYTCTDNDASIRLLERLGFAREGLLRGHAIIDGVRRDHFVYGLLHAEGRRKADVPPPV
jgi:RimJ/RimL family protein N-acetyltransferase